MQSNRKFVFKNGSDNACIKYLEVIIPEVNIPHHEMFTWPSAPFLAQYLFNNQSMLENKTVLELGCGTALVGIVAAKFCSHVFLSDNGLYESSFLCCRKSCLYNNVANVTVVPITWGRFSHELFKLASVDIILGSDSFYNKNDFEDILYTVSYFLNKNPNAVFWTSYQLRSCDYSIEFLLSKWNLYGRLLNVNDLNENSDYMGGLSINHELYVYEIRAKCFSR
ncbi:histone-arginine methyltransferase METTL23 isoform X2 [Hydra vulgaris]|uniref:Histone-arginine methyltransferase METTL23 isoform X2 n=1 Tax=Hydra vulgaris TaxID=6087 RepID=A0ABM4CHT4_HYDVU